MRSICTECKQAYEPDDQVLEQLRLRREEIGSRPFFYGEGCDECNQTGYKGRRGIYEYLRVRDPIRALINDRKPTLVIRDRARELGMRTLREDGVRCILDGSTTVEEILKVYLDPPFVLDVNRRSHVAEMRIQPRANCNESFFFMNSFVL